MVAVVNTGSSLRRTLNYNEQKVREQKAVCIHASGYPKEHTQLTFNNKLGLLQKYAALDENVTRNSVHISLNFHAADKLDRDKLIAIAGDYMNRIGFGSQPYLVYEHNDAGHPHIHLVSVKVRSNGKRIDMQNIGRNQSAKAREEIEKIYGLVKAEGRKQHETIKPANRAIEYGKSDSRRAIANVLGKVLDTYKYASLPELNAVLKLYNVNADNGSEGSRIFKNKGLIYHILDDKGNCIGVPIKASLFYNNPGLKYIEAKFAINEAARQSKKHPVKNAIDLYFLQHKNASLDGMIKSLEEKGISTVLRQNADGILYGITYVDHNTKCVFNGSALGKQYSVAGTLERCNEKQQFSSTKIIQHTGRASLQEQSGSGREAAAAEQMHDIPVVLPGSKNTLAETIQLLMEPAAQNDYVDPNLKKKKKKKRNNTSNRL